MSTLLFDTDAPSNSPQERTYTVKAGDVMLLTAAGLADGECVPIYVRVGSPGRAAVNCLPNSDPDYLWAPLSRCGTPVTLCGEANEYIERIPGTYMVGAPAGVTVAGNVNIAGTPLTAQYMHVQPYCSGGEPPCEPLAARGVQPAW
jgi:hypothetical protein